MRQVTYEFFIASVVIITIINKYIFETKLNDCAQFIDALLCTLYKTSTVILDIL